MTTKEKEVLLAFMKEQQRYNEALTAFCQLLCLMDDDSATVPDNSATVPDDSSSVSSPDNSY